MDSIFAEIRSKGGRITKIRTKIIQMLLKEKCLMSQADILAEFKKQKMDPDRSTIFREITFLTRNNIVKKNVISGIDYHEIPQDHHHHLVCLNCNSIKKIDIGDHLKTQERQISMKNKFNIISHSLEFYGYCRDCQTTARL